ncbi:autolysin [Dishui Lake large algae virus 1]|nr:autolysin [Dishui Lake large algae virus 1]
MPKSVYSHKAPSERDYMDELLYEDDEDDENVPIPSEEELNLFRQRVAEWTKLDDIIRKLSTAIRERKVHQRAITQKIQDFMKAYGYDNLNTQQGRIQHKVRQVKQPLKLVDVKTKILELQGVSGEELVKKIFEAERPVEEKTSLRRIVPKVSMSLDI